MANPSMIAELQSLELWRTKFEVASLAQSGLEGATFDSYFVYKNIFKLSDEEIEGVEEGKRRDKLFQMGLEGITGGTPPTEMPMDAAGAAPPPGGTPMPPADGNTAPPESGLPPPPGEEGGAPLETAAKDPNAQSAGPNELINPGHSNSHKVNSLPNQSQKRSSKMKGTAMDPDRSYSELMRGIRAPFGEEFDKESDNDKDEKMVEDNFNKKVTQLRRFAEELENIPALNASKTKKVVKG
jgi:hypothetical protein